MPCDPAGNVLAAGDACIVETEKGPEFGIVVQSGLCDPHRGETCGKLLRVTRPASREDEEAYSHKALSESEGREFCLARIAERNLPMKLGHVERQLDGRKMTFYFTAEGRVDFRELVRDLTARFHTRVELRQLGARDDAGMQGGCGPCGRALCCSGWLRGFEPVSIKMAKAQGLSLNPAKISGICNRLMCCLKFEYEGQAPSGRKAPCNERGRAVTSPSGAGPAAAKNETRD